MKVLSKKAKFVKKKNERRHQVGSYIIERSRQTG